MKKSLFPLIAAAGLGAILWAWIDSREAGSDRPSGDAPDARAIRTEVSQERGPEGADAARQRSHPGDAYQDHARTLEEGLASGDPVAIQRYVELFGACESIHIVRPGATPGRDVRRLQEFCGANVAGLSPEQRDEMWARGLHGQLETLEEESGKDAVRGEVSRLIDSDDPYAGRIALEYAASNEIIPVQLQRAFQENSVPGILSHQLGALGHIHFCRKGGGCGPDDFETLKACVVWGPCKPGDRFEDVIRRQIAPRDFDEALRLSRSLEGG